LLRGQLEQLNIQIQGLERVIIQSETSGLLMKDKEKRKAQVNELRSQYNFIRDGILEAINTPKTSNTVFLQFLREKLFSSKPVRTAEGETEEVKAMSNKELKGQAQSMLKSIFYEVLYRE